MTNTYKGLFRLAEAEDSLSANHRNRRQIKWTAQSRVAEVVSILQKEDAGGSFTQTTWRTRLAYDDWGRLAEIQRFGRSQNQVARVRRAWDSLGNLVCPGPPGFPVSSCPVNGAA